jgi:hypothetical protein
MPYLRSAVDGDGLRWTAVWRRRLPLDVRCLFHCGICESSDNRHRRHTTPWRLAVRRTAGGVTATSPQVAVGFCADRRGRRLGQ